MQKIFLRKDIDQLDKSFRTHLINSLGGFKSVNLIGTVNEQGQYNLAVFNSIVHIGANPPLMGFILRPTSVRRDTYNNILQTRCFTLNHLTESIYRQAHQTAARYEAGQSEFDACGLQPLASDLLPAPYVAQSRVRIGLAFREAIPIPLNGTHLIIGEILEIQLPAHCLSADGYLDLQAAGSLTVAGLDAYHGTRKIDRLSYAKPGLPLQSIPFQQLLP